MSKFGIQIIKTLRQNEIQVPVLVDEITLDRNYNSSAATLTFTCQKDEKLSFSMGDIVVFIADYKTMFRGRVFKKSRSSDGKIQVTAYDNLRYLLNEDTVVLGQDDSKKGYYTLKDLLDKIKGILKGYSFTMKYSIVGDEISAVQLDPVVYEDKSYIDMIFDTFDKIKTKKGLNLTIYDDDGKFIVCDISDLVMESDNWMDPVGRLGKDTIAGRYVIPIVPGKTANHYVVSNETIEDFSHEESIDDDVYTVAKLTTDGENASKIQSHLTFAEDNYLKQYGPLVYREKLDAKDFERTGKAIIEEKGAPKHTFSVTGCVGWHDVRGGSGLYVHNVDVGHAVYRQFMLVKEVTHKFKGQTHTMDLKFTNHPKYASISRME